MTFMTFHNQEVVFQTSFLVWGTFQPVWVSFTSWNRHSGATLQRILTIGSGQCCARCWWMRGLYGHTACGIYVYIYIFIRLWLGQVIKDRHHCMQIYWLLDFLMARWCLSICGGKQDWNAQRTYLMSILHLYIIAWYHIISFHIPWYQFLGFISALIKLNQYTFIYTHSTYVCNVYVCPPSNFYNPCGSFFVQVLSAILKRYSPAARRWAGGRDVLNWSRNAYCRWDLWKR